MARGSRNRAFWDSLSALLSTNPVAGIWRRDPHVPIQRNRAISPFACATGNTRQNAVKPVQNR
jgi:hypothetical protein